MVACEYLFRIEAEDFMRKNWKTRLGCFVMAGILAMTGFGMTACGDKEKEVSSEKHSEKTMWEEGSIVRIGDIQVDYREALLYLQSTKEEYEVMYGVDIWQYQLAEDGSTLGEWVKDQTLEQIIYMKIICSQAEELGISLNEDDWSNINEQTLEYMSHFAETDLILYGIDEEIVRQIYADNALALKVYESVTLNVVVKVPEEEARQRRYQSLNIKNYNEDELGNRVSLTVLELIEVMDKVDELFEKAQTTNDLYALAFANTEDDTYLDVTIGKGDLPEEIEAEVLAMQTGETKMVKTPEEYYIFHCVSDYEEDATMEKKEELIAIEQEAEFLKLYQKWKEDTFVEVNEEIWKAIGFDTDAQG